MSTGAVIFWLLVGHAVADYPLQGDFLARGKNHRTPLAGVPWQQCLMSHAAIHAGAVALVTGSIGLGLAEYSAHWIIDWSKCEGLFGEGRRAFNIDQWLHLACKLVWAGLWWGMH